MAITRRKLFLAAICLLLVVSFGFVNWPGVGDLPSPENAVTDAAKARDAAKDYVSHPTILLWSWRLGPCLYLAGATISAILIDPKRKGARQDPQDPWRASCFAALTIVPAIYFFVEATWMYGVNSGKDEFYKLAQDLASRVWAAASLLLGFYWFRETS